ncbi:MAG: hypothetical protein P8Y93_09750 [Acidobacteriota bacterium]
MRWATRSAEARSGKGPTRSLYSAPLPDSRTVISCWFERGKPRPSSFDRASAIDAELDDA